MNRVVYLSAFFFHFVLLADFKVLTSNLSELSLELSVPTIETKTKSVDNRKYTGINIPDGIFETVPGNPEIPFYRIHVSVPLGKKPSFTLIKVERRSINLKTPVSPLLRVPTHDGIVRKVPINQSAYQRKHGTRTIEIEEAGFAGTEKLVALRWSPFRYDPTKGKLSWTHRAILRVDFIDEKTLLHETRRKMRSEIASLFVVNPEILPPRIRAEKKIDLVIAHESYRSALSFFLGWKRVLGHEIRDHYVANKTNSQILQIIRAEYESVAPPTSTLLVGSIDQVPSWRGSSDNTWTDLNYQKLDSDTIPDIALGRIPAQTTQELSNFLPKISSREYSTRNVEEVLLTAGRDTSLGCPDNVTRVGKKFQVDSNPVNLTKKYRTEVSSKEVWDAYSANPNIVVYDGHGDRRGMQEIPLLISNMTEISNTVFPIVLDIACLNANWLSSGAGGRNFAEILLLDPNRGFAGILGSGGSGFGHEFFQYIAENMAMARRQMATEPLLNEIARVIWAAKVRGNSEDRSYWNYYGDPTSSVWESTMGPGIQPLS